MNPKITNEALEAYCYCAQKFHLKLRGEHGVTTDYERMRAELRAKTMARAIKRHLEKQEPDKRIRLTRSRLEKLPQYLFNGMYEDNHFKLKIDGVHKTTAPHASKSYTLRPIIFSGFLKNEAQLRRVLAVYGYALSKLVSQPLHIGLIWNSSDSITKVSLRVDKKEFSTWLQKLIGARLADSPPPLLLNDHCQVCEFQQRCRKQALTEGNLSLLKGMTVNEVAKYNPKGIFTINQLSYTFRSRRRSRRARATTGPHYFSLQAQALREKKIFIHGTVDFKVDEPRVYFDIEGTPDTHSHYLIGALVLEHGKEQFTSFWAGQDDERGRIFSKFLRYLSKFPRYSLIHFGSYETVALQRTKSYLPVELAPILEEALARSTNLLSAIRTRVYFPTYSNSLKEIGEFLGARWSQATPSGIHTIAWREKWLNTGDPMWKERLLRYNRDDCLALKRVAECLDDLIAKQGMPRELRGDTDSVFTDTLPRSERKGHVFRKQEFAIRDFERINRCAYFDYSRDRITARSGRPKKRREGGSLKKRRWKLRLNKIAYLTAQKCPNCRSRKINAGRSIARTIIDLKLSASGVKRWIVRYQSNEYACQKCRAKFIPGGIPPVSSKFGWGLASWCMYNHVVAGQNLNRVTAGLGHLFRLSVPQPTVYRFKEYVSDHYKTFCRELFAELIGSPYLHIDETPVKLRSNPGYVWVLTNGDAAYYFYRDSREGAFLKELLEGFSGVLISDFFTAYDSLNVRQQRCLIHLLRDFNEELLKAPYDQELRMLGDQFAAVLGVIVDTIDKHGLTRWHLSKHKAAAEKFVGLVSESNFISGSASKLQARITKYKTMLFTFLDCDGVSWNNNNAERAMKTFARHRRFADGKFTLRSIEHHLAILTVYQTCEFRHLDFLDFVLGRKNAGVGPSVPWILNERLVRRRPVPESLPGFDAVTTRESAREVGRDGLEDAGSSPTPG